MGSVHPRALALLVRHVRPHNDNEVAAALSMGAIAGFLLWTSLGAKTTIWTVAVVLLVLLPMSGNRWVQVLRRMRAGSFLELLQNTGNTGRDLADALVLGGLTDVMRRALPIYPGLVLAFGLVDRQAVSVMVITLWLPAVTLVTVACMYLQIAADVWAAAGHPWLRWGAGVVAVPPVLGFMGAGLLADVRHYESMLSVFFIVTLMASIVIGRGAARWGMDHVAGVASWLQSLQTRRSISPVRHRNPVAQRLLQQATHRGALGRPGVYLGKAAVALTICGFMKGFLLLTGFNNSPLCLIPLGIMVAYLIFFQVSRAVLKVEGFVDGERQRHTLELVAQTRLTPVEYADGVAIAASVPLMVESILIALLCPLYAGDMEAPKLVIAALSCLALLGGLLFFACYSRFAMYQGMPRSLFQLRHPWIPYAGMIAVTFLSQLWSMEVTGPLVATYTIFVVVESFTLRAWIGRSEVLMPWSEHMTPISGIFPHPSA